MRPDTETVSLSIEISRVYCKCCLTFSIFIPMPRQRLSLASLTQTALALIDEEGFAALNLSAVAAGLDVGPSALYGHVDGLDGLKHLVAVAATDNLTDTVRAAAIGNAGVKALTRIGSAYRAFSHEHPGQFASTLLPPDATAQDLNTANDALLEVFSLVYRADGFEPGAAHLAARSTRSAIHGFLALEHLTGTSPSHNAEYDHLLAALADGLAHRTLDQSSNPRSPA